ncbi:MAG TPA: sigma-54 dependent transcriptional regulator [Phycisphaerae bacterium]|nr:sigma-54 dependent transcriptional regulator [Phycisphaerae bacterium]HRY71250.1 sigma-54 dependent transcriptional regulator [Phycisphaerae bacterium]HSA29670.1 sigma-54 dependent transcriptional regulator [Phycisphaerae bacterium]
MADILIVDDDANLRVALEMSLKQAGHHCRLANTGAQGWAELQQQQPDLALLDLQLPDTSGVELLARMHEERMNLPVIIMTAFGTVTNAVSAMKQGAADFIEKPLSVKDMCRLVVRLLKSRELVQRIDHRPQVDLAETGEAQLIAASPAMKQVMTLAEKIARLPTRSGIGLTATLICGDTGTGKEMIARFIHRLGPNPNGPFIHVNCTAIPESLFEMEHFGHERGVFTDAKSEKQGLLEAANGGTLLLDEIGDMPLQMQGKLLVAIETGRFRRVGATAEQTVDARILAATNIDLEEKAQAGRFRMDLYHRLKMFQITLPPLRERPDDLWALSDYFLGQFSRQLQRPIPRLTPEARESIRSYSWPGNVRELAHVILQALVTGDEGDISPTHLGLPLSPSAAPSPSPAAAIELDFSAGSLSLAEVERRLLQAALAHAQNNITEAARLLGMPRGTLRYRLEKLGLV